VEERWVIDVAVMLPGKQMQRVRDFSPVNTRRGAEQHERLVRQALLDGTYGKEIKEAPTLEQFSEPFLNHARTNNKHSTATSKADIVRKHLVPEFGRMKLDEISQAKIETFKAKALKKGLTKKSVNNILAVLHKLFVTAEEFGTMQAAPRIRWLKAPKPDFDFLTFEEADRLVANAEPGRWKTMIVVALNTGLRIGELAGLAWDCVDLAGGRLMVKRAVYKGRVDTPKGGLSREVPLNQAAIDALRAHPRRLGSKWVFPQYDGNFIRNPQHASVDAIARNAERAGLRRIGWHTLRHTFASHLVMLGKSLKEVQELLGHTTIDMTMRYAHLSPEAKKDAVRALDERRNGTCMAQREGVPEKAVAESAV
jgi:integrase